MKYTRILLSAAKSAPASPELTLEQLKSKLIKLSSPSPAVSKAPRHRGKPTSKDFFIPNSNRALEDNSTLRTSPINGTAPPTLSLNDTIPLTSPVNGSAALSSSVNHPTTANKKQIKRKKNRKRKESFSPINWNQGFNTSDVYKPKATTSYQAKSEFDAMIKDWITTNWINVDQVKMQQKPCHFLIHDRMVYQGLSVFDAVLTNMKVAFPTINFNSRDLRQRWDDEFSTMALLNNESSASVIGKKFRELVKTVFWPVFKAQNGPESSVFDQYIGDPRYEECVIGTIQKDVVVNEKMVNYLKNFENLNVNNNFTYVKDRELSLLPSLDYLQLLWDVASKKDAQVFRNFSVLKYSYVFGNKVNDFKNLDRIKSIMSGIPSAVNPYFIMLTNDKQTSLEYYRLLKLLKQADEGDSEKNGCVVFLNEAVDSRNSSFFPPDNIKVKSYVGETYNVIDHFGEVYDVLEGL
ncbi:DEKNAAC102554 [Brettanomyces naardenensis]|uniref:DEKNAAC102554 n=1 Tax=Brettanomyces naardenensis TaxID=13370 RepID=A0A448YLM5_BRENA|nr:DEKNAAC102554 [Brettanomyces naardenensis]